MELHISLSGRGRLRAEIYGQIRSAVLEGRLRSGEALPPTRELARRLGVSRNTVEVAYERLAGEGYVAGRRGSGTYVSEVAAAPPRAEPVPRDAGASRARPVWRRIPLSRAFERPVRFDFRTGLPDATLFPHGAWRRLVARELRSDATGAGMYGHPAGQRGLREAIARHVAVSRGVHASAEDVVVTNGAQQAIDVIARALLEPGDTVAMEDPGYLPPQRLFLSLGARVVGVPVDREGLVVGAIPPEARLVYVTPSHQYPLGVSMSLARRRALLDRAERQDATIIEDDYDTEFRFAGRPLEPLWALDASGRVVYVGTFSKTMLPSLRLGFLVAPPSLRNAIHRVKLVSDWHTSAPLQGALARFLEDGGFARHVRRMSGVYRERHELLTGTLARELGDELEVWPSINGLHVAAVARSATAEEVERWAGCAASAGVGVQPLATFRVERPPVPGLALAYGAIATGDVVEGLRRLRACLD